MILTILSFLLLVTTLHLSGKIFSPEIKLSLYIFSIFYLIFNYYPFFFLFLEKKTFLELGANSFVSIEPNFKLIIIYISSFFLLFCSGMIFINFFFEKYIKFKVYKININYVSYKYSVYAILITIFLLFIYLYHDLISTNYTYTINQKTNFGFYSFLKEIIIFFLTIIFFLKKRGNIIYFSFLVFLISLLFLTKDKDWLIFIFAVMVTQIYLNNKKIVNTNNFLITFLGISIFLFYFLPFFSIFRTFTFFYSLNYSFRAVFIEGYRVIGDPSSQLAILYLLINDVVSLKYHNVLSNFTSFLPTNLRLYDADYAIKFAKEILGDGIHSGQGFSFSMLSEMIIYIKTIGYHFSFLIVFLVGTSYYFIIKLITLIVPKNIKIYIIVFYSCFMSFTIVRSSLSGYLQFSFRYLIVIFSIYCIHKLFLNLIKKKLHGHEK